MTLDDIAVSFRSQVDAYGQAQYAQGKTDQSVLDATALATVQATVTRLTAQVDGLTTQVASLNAEIADLAAQLAAAKASVPPPGAVTPKTAADIQAIISQGTTAEKPLLLPKGDWVLTKQLKIPTPGAFIWWADGARLLRGYSTGGGTSAAFIANADWTQRIAVLELRGVVNISALPNMTGNIFGLLVDNVTCDQWQCDDWLGGRLGMVAGDHHRWNGVVAHCDPVAGTGSGGFRFAGGTDFRFAFFDLTAGDDSVQYVPAGDPKDPLWNVADIVDAQYAHGKVRSLTARAVIAALQDDKNDGTPRLGMRVSIRDAHFIDIDGQPGGSGAVAQNRSSLGEITNVTFPGVSLDMSLGVVGKGQPADVYAETSVGLGGVSNVDFSGITRTGDLRNRKLFATKGPVVGVTAPGPIGTFKVGQLPTDV